MNETTSCAWLRSAALSCSLVAASSWAGTRHDILIPPPARQLQVAEATLREGRTESIRFRGAIRTAGVVTYGWFDGGDIDLEMQFEPSAFGEASIPRLRSCIQGICADSFVLKNPEAVALRLFGRAALADLMSRRVLSLSTSATLTLTDLSFYNECGFHYTATVVPALALPAGSQLASADGVRAHC